MQIIIFQFLMVRLKVIKKIIKDYEIFKFQFLMVRLKDYEPGADR